MLLNEIMSELVKLNIKKNRGKNVKKLVQAAAKCSNPSWKGPRDGQPGNTITDVAAPKPEDMGHFSGMM
jgi:hypothetical protein